MGVIKSLSANLTAFFPGIGMLLSCALITYGWTLWKSHERLRAVQRKRKDQGHHECEVFESCCPIAMESSGTWGNCTKNQGHSTFILAKDVALDHLPEAYRVEELFELIRNVSARTVRLRVNYTSSGRPEGLPFHEFRGQWIPHTGSGWLRDIRVGHGRCPQCKEQNTKCSQWWLIRVHTACHVVFDTSEARQTLVDVFYDSEDTKDGRMKTIQGLKVITKNEDQDLCRFYGITHDADLIDELQVHMKRWDKQPTSRMGTSNWQNDYASVCVIVSHPHGRAKRVTVGKWVGHTEQDEIGACAITYTTDTCCGSSGAPVILPRRQAADGELVCWTPTVFPHSGAHSDQLNISAG